MKRIFITGIAGFIGFHLAKALRLRGDVVDGFDLFNAYYSPQLKRKRADLLKELGVNVIDLPKTLSNYSHCVHLAAQPGVRYSIDHPEEYGTNNLQAFIQILELCRHANIPLVYASSSSVYGLNTKTPFSESDPVDQPANLYGATKRANELMAYSYHHLYNLRATGLRFFTVYGPWGRPDMAYYKFANAIMNEKPVPVYNHGDLQRDFTYIDDIIDGVISSIDHTYPCEVFNLGNHKPESVMTLIQYLENTLGKKALIENLPMQPGDIKMTCADLSKSQKMLGYFPKISLEEGITKFSEWIMSEAIML